MRWTGANWFWLCAGLLLALGAAGLAIPRAAPPQFGIGYGAALQEFVGIACLQAVVYGAAVAILLRTDAKPGLLWILGVAALLRLMVLVAPPFLSNDMYRYIWDGWVQGAGINPYLYIPDDWHLAFLRDAVVFPNINRAKYAPTIYPPAAQMVFAVATGATRLLHLPPVFGLKLAIVGIEAVGIWAMLRLLEKAGLPRQRILIYAWNPLPVWEFAGNGHVDAIAVCFVALALLAVASGKSGWGAAALAGAVLTKFLPVVLLPALWRRWDWKFAVVFVGVLLLLYLPYLDAQRRVLGFLGGYAAEENIASGRGILLLDLLGLAVPVPVLVATLYLGLLTMVLAAIGAMMVFRPALSVRSVARYALLIGGVLMVGISPHYPWYFAFLLVPACIAPSPATLYLVSASCLLYLNPTHDQPFWPAMVFGPYVMLAAWDYVSARPAVAVVQQGLKT